MNFGNVSPAKNISNGVQKRKLTETFSFSTKRLVQLFLLPLLALAAVVLLAPPSYADVTGTTARLYSGANPQSLPAPVGSDIEFDLFPNGGAKLDIDPLSKTVTITLNQGGGWGTAPSVRIEFTGGNLTQITSASRTGGTASNAADYSASASAKSITINLPVNRVTEDGTVVFSFTSRPDAPAMTENPSNSTIAVGADTTFSVTASDATSYQWQSTMGPATPTSAIALLIPVRPPRPYQLPARPSA